MNVDFVVAICVTVVAAIQSTVFPIVAVVGQ